MTTFTSAMKAETATGSIRWPATISLVMSLMAVISGGIGLLGSFRAAKVPITCPIRSSGVKVNHDEKAWLCGPGRNRCVQQFCRRRWLGDCQSHCACRAHGIVSIRDLRDIACSFVPGLQGTGGRSRAVAAGDLA